MDAAFTTPRTDDSGTIHAGRATLDRMKRLPSDGAIHAVGDIYAKHAEKSRRTG